MEIPNLECKKCPYSLELWREHCKDCLFNLEQLFKAEKPEDLLTDKDGEFCMGCGFKYTNPEKCEGCIGQK